MKRFFVFLCVVVLLSSCGGDNERPGFSDEIGVQTMTVSGANMPMERNYVGSVCSEREVSLNFVLGGRLTEVRVKNGQMVRKGQLLARVDATSAESLHKGALATLRQAEDAYKRLEAVYKDGGLSDVKWMEMQTNLEKARQSEIAARKHLDDCSIYAPFDGVVSCNDVQVGQEMRPTESFGKLIDKGRMCVRFSVPEQEVSLIALGDKATATIPALDNAELVMKIRDKGIMANPMGHTYKVEATITGGDVKSLLPDMVARVNLSLVSEGGIVVPAKSIQTMPEGTMLWVVRDGVAKRQLVEVGDFVKSGVVIENGLNAGDTVVVAGYQKLYTGAKVKVLEN